MCAAMLLLLAAALPDAARAQARPNEAARIFEQRILPIFNSPHPSSCVECHLSGVDLKDYILPSHEQTFLSLRDQGLVDVARPEQSKILRFIAMKDDQAQGGGAPAARVSEKVRKLEHEAFAAWIKASCRDARLRRAPRLATEKLAQPKRPPEIIRHARTDRVLASFVADVWSQRFRCSNCHAAGSKQNEKIVREQGEEVTWIRPEGPAATIDFLLANGNIDLDQPLRSRLLRKATGEIKHGGGVKMRVGDAAYVALRRWLEDYARVKKDGYGQVAELPAGPAWFESEIWLRVTSAPSEWKGKLVRMTVHAPSATTGAFEDEPIAVTSTIAEQNKDNKRWGTFAHMTLSLRVAAPELLKVAREDGGARLESGKYQVRLYVGPAEGVAMDLSLIGRAHFMGQTEVAAEWRPGYKNALEIDAGQIRL